MKGFDITIPLHIYPHDVLISVGQTDVELAFVLSRIYAFDEYPDYVKYVDLNKANGYAETLKNGSSIIRVKAYEDTPQWIATFAHEVFHVVSGTLRKAGLQLTNKSEEAYAYLTSYIIREFYKQLNKKLKK